MHQSQDMSTITNKMQRLDTDEMPAVATKRVRSSSTSSVVVYDVLPKFDVDELYNPCQITVVTKSMTGQIFDFTVPRELLCAYSECFAGALEGGINEANQRILELVDVEKEVFGCFVTYMHIHNIVLSPNVASSSKALFDSNDATTFSWLFLVKLYIFAEKYAARGFQSMVFEKIQTKALQKRPLFYDPPEPRVVDMIYRDLPASSPLRAFLPEYFVLWTIHLQPEERPGILQHWSNELLMDCEEFFHRHDAAKKCGHCNGGHTKLRDGVVHTTDDAKLGVEKDWCYYHQHESEQEQIACLCRFASFRWKLFEE